MTRLSATPPGTLLCRMAPDDKPYRVYKGGRVKGKVPAVPGKPRPQPNRATPKTGGKGPSKRRLPALPAGSTGSTSS